MADFEDAGAALVTADFGRARAFAATAIARLKQLGWETMESCPRDERLRWMLCADCIAEQPGRWLDGCWQTGLPGGPMKLFSPYLWREPS